MRRWLWLLAAAVVPMIAACKAPSGGENPGQQGAPVKPAQRSWTQLSAYPALQPDAFWAPDQPAELEPEHFGVLPAELPVYVSKPSVQRFVLEATLPKAPAELPVYLLGAYPTEYTEQFASLVRLDHRDCGFVPPYSLVHCNPDDAPTGSRASVETSAQAEARAKDLLGDLYSPDYRTEAVIRDDDGRWRVVFTQIVNEIPVYMDKPLQVHLNTEGQMEYALGRRRPLLAKSPYPLRSPESAWRKLESGEGVGLDILYGSPAPEGQEPFVVKHVELAYVVTHANSAKEIMQPYYRFVNEQGRALFVPAVADQSVTWPVPQ